jgi:predicted RNase H-like nuclease
VFVGVDGCRAGWFAVWKGKAGLEGQVFPTFRELVRGPWTILAIDVPVGLREASDLLASEPRAADTEARRALGPGLSSRVFDAPVREALAAESHRHAIALSMAVTAKGVSAQCYGLFRKIKEVDDALAETKSLRELVFETHPELVFASLNGGSGVRPSKKEREGLAVRSRLLGGPLGRSDLLGPLREGVRKSAVADDDILDACAALVAAQRVGQGCAAPLPDPPETDARGLRMAIWV